MFFLDRSKISLSLIYNAKFLKTYQRANIRWLKSKFSADLLKINPPRETIPSNHLRIFFVVSYNHTCRAPYIFLLYFFSLWCETSSWGLIPLHPSNGGALPACYTSKLMDKWGRGVLYTHYTVQCISPLVRSSR
jgi:hypothetical protein